jgi:carboxylesterase
LGGSLISEYKKLDVLGLSLGGLLACELNKQFPLNHLYLLAPALKLHMNVNTMINIARLLKYLGFVHLRNAAGNISHTEHAEITYRKLPLATIIEILHLVQHYQWVPPNCPTDLFLGTNDLVVNSEAVEQLFRPSANTNIHWLHNSAHVLPLDNDLNKIIQCINKKTK